MKDYYLILGMSRSASSEDVKKTFRRLEADASGRNRLNVEDD